MLEIPGKGTMREGSEADRASLRLRGLGAGSLRAHPPSGRERTRRAAGRRPLAPSRVAGVVAVYTLIEAWRSRLPVLVGALLGAAFVVAGFAEEMALTEALATRNILHAAMLRAGAVLTLALFVVTSVVREGNDRTVVMVLSQPRPRADYFFGKLAAGTALAAGMAALCGLCLLPHAPLRPVLLWAASLALELWMVAAASLLCVLAFRHVVAVFLSVLAFYLLGRSIGALRLLSESPLTASPGWSEKVIDTLVTVLYHLLPDLGAHARSDWLVYPPAGTRGLLTLALQAAAFVALLSGAALFDLYRRNL